MKSHRRLNQSLVKESKGTPSQAPQVFPRFMGFEVLSGIEEVNSVLK
jgi:hypothetical protein